MGMTIYTPKHILRYLHIKIAGLYQKYVEQNQKDVWKPATEILDSSLLRCVILKDQYLFFSNLANIIIWEKSKQKQGWRIIYRPAKTTDSEERKCNPVTMNI